MREKGVLNPMPVTHSNSDTGQTPTSSPGIRTNGEEVKEGGETQSAWNRQNVPRSFRGICHAVLNADS